MAMVDAAVALTAAYRTYADEPDGTDVPYARDDIVLADDAPWRAYVDLERSTARFDGYCTTGTVLTDGAHVIEVTPNGPPSEPIPVAAWDDRHL